MIRCREAYKLIWSDEKMGLWKRFNLAFHLLICPNCQSSQKVLKALEKKIKLGAKSVQSSDLEGQIINKIISRKVSKK